MIEMTIWDDPQTARTRQYGNLDAAMAGIRAALEEGRPVAVRFIRVSIHAPLAGSDTVEYMDII